MRYRVITSMMDMKSVPAENDDSKVLFRIPFRHTVTLIEKTSSKWWRVRLLNTDKEGFVLANELELIDQSTEKVADILIPNFEFAIQGGLDTKIESYKPLGDPSIPFRDLTSVESKLASIHQIIEKLNVSKSFKYEKDEADTYCNVYSFDFCFFAKVYIPRLRWTDKAIEELEKGNEVEIIFEDTVRPLYSNYIYEWFLESGEVYGWQKIECTDELQEKVNTNGGVGVIIARRFILDKSGHIVVVVPENDTEKAYRENGKVIYPLQSQAGLINYNYFSENRKDWWNNQDPEKGYSTYVFYYHA